MTTYAQNRFSPMKFTKSQKQRNRGYSPKNKELLVKKNQRYYCHHPNSVYMGGVESYDKSGKGVLLMDDGSCLLTHFVHNKMFGLNILFSEHSLTSIIVDGQSNKDICFRYREYMLRFKMKKNEMVEGNGYLIDFQRRVIYELKFHRSILIKKTKMVDQKIQDKVFNSQQYEHIVGVSHASTMNLNFGTHPQISSFKQDDNNYAIGFIDRKKKQINGVAFKALISNSLSKFDIQIQDRGYYVKSVLEEFGRINFKNGNYYYGQLQNGKFHGRGILVHAQDQKWTYGTYYQNQLIQVLDSSVSTSSSSRKSSPGKKQQNINSALKSLHQFERSYMKANICITPSHSFSFDILCLVIKGGQVRNIIDSEEERNSGLKKILDDFMSGQYAQDTEEAIRQVLKQSNISKNNQEDDPLQANSSQKNFNEPENIGKSNQQTNQKAHHSKKDANYPSRQATKNEPKDTQSSPKINRQTLSNGTYCQKGSFTDLNRELHLTSRWREYLQIRDKFSFMEKISRSRSFRKIDGRVSPSRLGYSPIRKF